MRTMLTKSKVFVLLIFAVLLAIKVNAQESMQLELQQNQANIQIHKEIYGQFAEHLGRCIYDGFWVDSNLNVPKQGRIRMDIVEALKKIKVPALRWPGGCFGDEYHWRDGIGASMNRPKTVNTTWGMITEDNSFGTHEFLELCKLIGCEPYIAGNVGTGTPQEMASWIEYLNYEGKSTLADLRKANGHPDPYHVSFWGVGNESWGCGGDMTPEYYSDLYKKYANFCENYPDSPLKKIASGANGDDFHWTEVLMKNIHPGQMWGISLHYYTIPTGNWSNKGSATQFDEKEYFSTMKNCLRMDDILKKNEEIMDKYDPQKRVALVVDEWGVWTNPEPNSSILYQQNSMRDALIAGSTLNIFNNHAERVKMAALAQSVNVLQSLVLTQGEKMLLTPTYYVFDLYKVHQDAKLIPLNFQSPDLVEGDDKISAVNASASIDDSGKIHITLVNLDPNKSIVIGSDLEGKWKSVSGEIVHSASFTDHNTFDQPNNVVEKQFNDAKLKGGKLSVSLPPLSVVMLELKTQ